MYAHSVPIGPEFFKKAFDDYSDRYWAFVREIMQNSLDCGSTTITISIRQHIEDGADTTTVNVTNNGEPMSREILTEKLLALGSSGKDFKDGSVGGFGACWDGGWWRHLGSVGSKHVYG